MAMETALIWVSSSPALWLATVALLFLCARLLRRQKLNLPSCPKHWPIVGNLNLIGPFPHRSIHELSKKYGPIMFLKFGSFRVLVGSSAEIAKTILKTHDIIFATRPKTAGGKYTTYNYSDITWSPYGPYWRQARRICALELFSAKRLDSFEYIRREELVGVLRKLHGNATNKKPIHLKNQLTDLGLNVISRMVMGKKYIEYSEDSIIAPNEFKEMLDELVLLNGVMNVGDFIPWLAFLDLHGYVKRMKALAKKFDRFLEHVLDEHIKRRKGLADYVARDMVDLLLQLSEDPTLEVKLERHGVKGFCLDLIAGGTESSEVTVEYAMCELLRKPEIMKKAQEELERVIGKDKWVEEKDTVNLPYINAIIKETMRLHAVSPILPPRESLEDCKIDGCDIPRGTRILVSVFSIARDPAIWEDPEEFYPERFIGKSTDVKGYDYELLPFGGGRRMCPGYTLGMKVIQASLSNLLHGFNWELPEGMKKEELDMEEICGLTTSKKNPLVVMAEPRLPLQVY